VVGCVCIFGSFTLLYVYKLSGSNNNIHFILKINNSNSAFIVFVIVFGIFLRDQCIHTRFIARVKPSILYIRLVRFPIKRFPSPNLLFEIIYFIILGFTSWKFSILLFNNVLIYSTVRLIYIFSVLKSDQTSRIVNVRKS
jgi:hypothetical protein